MSSSKSKKPPTEGIAVVVVENEIRESQYEEDEDEGEIFDSDSNLKLFQLL